MSQHINNAQNAANRGAAAPDTRGLEHNKKQQAEKAFQDQQKKNNQKQ